MTVTVDTVNLNIEAVIKISDQASLWPNSIIICQILISLNK